VGAERSDTRHSGLAGIEVGHHDLHVPPSRPQPPHHRQRPATTAGTEIDDAGRARGIEDGLELRRDTVIDAHAIEGDVEEVGGAVSHGTRQPGLIFELEQMDATH
jgi:hypothetical protein